MYLTKEVRCPICNAIPEDTGIMLASNPPYSGIKCSSKNCTWKGYIHDGTLTDENYKVIEKI